MMNRFASMCAGLSLFGISISTYAESRDWTSSDGKKVSGELAGFEDGTVTLITERGQFELPLDRLSEADQAFVKNWKAEMETAAAKEKGAKSDDKTVGNFEGLILGEWPASVTADSGGDFEIEFVKEDKEAGEYVYRSKHFEFHTNDRLSISVVREFSRIFEATFQLTTQIPFGLEPKAPGNGYYLTKLYKTRDDYMAAGGMQGSGGMFSWRRSNGKWEGVIKIPLPNLGVEYTGTRYIVDHDRQNTTLVHEITHQVMMRWLPLMPTWMSEGFAELCSSADYARGRFKLNSINRAVKEEVAGDNREKKMLNIESLMKITSKQWADSLASGNGRVNYDSANLLLTYFAKLDGEGKGEALVNYLKAVSAGTPKDDAAQECLLRGRTYEELQADVEKAWRSEGLRLEFVSI